MMRTIRKEDDGPNTIGTIVRLGILVIIGILLIPIWGVNAAPPNPPGDIGPE